MSDAFPYDYARYDGDLRSSWERLTWIEEKGVGPSSAIAKLRPAHEIILEAAVISVGIETDRSASEPSNNKSSLLYEYPKWLINMFMWGCVFGVLGIILLVVTPFLKMKGGDIAGGVFSAVGAVAVALAILRGQDVTAHQ